MTTTKKIKQCCGTSVGVIARDRSGRYLMVTRAWHPVGVAPVAGHVNDEHLDPIDAAHAEMQEEAGLTVVSLDPVWEGHRPNLCSNLPADPPGHYWWLVDAEVIGELAPDPEETRGAGWYTPAQVQALADRTVLHAHGRITDAEYQEQPGLEAVWVRHLADLGRIDVNPVDLAQVDKTYRTPPATYWRG